MEEGRAQRCAMKRNETRQQLRLCCDTSKRAALVLHVIASTWSSCGEMPIQRLFLALCAAQGHWICGADAQDAHAHAEECGVKTHARADDAHVE